MSLARMQQAFQAWLETGEGNRSDAAVLPPDPGLAVYLNNYRGALVEVLEDSFPITRQWMGEDAFGIRVRSHIMRSPPSSWSLDHYPPTFAAALADDADLPVGTREIAAIEAALDAAFIAADRPELTRAALSELDWEAVALALPQGAAILRQTSNAAAIWAALDRGEEPPAAALHTRPVDLLVWRAQGQSCFRPLDADEGRVFAALALPQPLTGIFALLSEGISEQAAIARGGELLARWADEGSVSIA